MSKSAHARVCVRTSTHIHARIHTLIHCSVREPGSQLGLSPICALNSSNKRAIGSSSHYYFLLSVGGLCECFLSLFFSRVYEYSSHRNFLLFAILVVDWKTLLVTRNRQWCGGMLWNIPSNSYAPWRSIASADVIRYKNNYYERVLFFSSFASLFNYSSKLL